jgi:hypothetical protein
MFYCVHQYQDETMGEAIRKCKELVRVDLGSSLALRCVVL